VKPTFPVRGEMEYRVPEVDGRETFGKLLDVKFVPDPKGRVLVWEPPMPGEVYALGLDPCNGIPGGDDAAIEILTVRKCRQVAEWCDNVNPVEAMDILCALGQWYNWSKINAEINIQGHALITRSEERQYPNRFRWRQWDEARLTNKLFWQTNRQTRPEMFSTMLRWFELRMIAISSEALLGELSTFQKMTDTEDEGGPGRDRMTFKQQPNQPDNRVMALCIAIQTIKQIPQMMEMHSGFGDLPDAADLGLQGYNQMRQEAIYQRVDENKKMAQAMYDKYIAKEGEADSDDSFSWNPIRGEYDMEIA
jgi:hypothetical protein